MKEENFKKLFINFLELTEKEELFSDPEIDIIMDIRNSYSKYCKEVSYFLVYPAHSLEKSEMIKEDIKMLCDDLDIKYNFQDLKSEWSKKGLFCFFEWNNKNITNIIGD